MFDILTPFYACEPRYRGIEAVIRIGTVKRWHMIDTTTEQTLAAHSANVALLAYLVAQKAPDNFFGLPATVALHALLHDVPEVFSGDIPTPTKVVIRGDVDSLEQTLLPHEFHAAGLPTTEQKTLIKMCDLADGARHIRLHGKGKAAQHAMDGLYHQFTTIKNKAFEQWPQDVAVLAIDQLQYYAYEDS